MEEECKYKCKYLLTLTVYATYQYNSCWCMSWRYIYI